MHACARAGAEAQRRQDLQADEPAHHGLVFIIIIILILILILILIIIIIIITIIIILIIVIKVVFSPPLSASLHGEHTL